MLDLLERGPVFMGSMDNYEQAELVLIGAPMEVTVSFVRVPGRVLSKSAWFRPGWRNTAWISTGIWQITAIMMLVT